MCAHSLSLLGYTQDKGNTTPGGQSQMLELRIVSWALGNLT